MTARTRAPRPWPPREQLIAALMPDVERKPMPQVLPLPMLPTLALPRVSDPDTLLIGAARVDRSGRIHERRLFGALGWAPGHVLELDAVHGVIVIASVPGGRHRVDRRGAIALPAAARHLCGITFGPPVVLAAAQREQILVVHSTATVGRLLAAHYADVIGGTDAR